MLANGDVLDMPVAAREGHEEAAERDVRRHVLVSSVVELVDLRRVRHQLYVSHSGQQRAGGGRKEGEQDKRK